MNSTPLLPTGPPVSRDRIIPYLPRWYTPEAALQLNDHFPEQVREACRQRNMGAMGLKMSKVVMVGDLCVGKTSLINRFCKDVFDRDYKATIGVDFEIERFEIAGVPFSLQIWDTAGQEKFKCIASAYYRGAEVIITVFNLADIQTLEHTKRWLEDALRENSPGSSTVFLVGTKKDLVGCTKLTKKSDAECKRTEADAVHMANRMQAEYWSVSAKTELTFQVVYASDVTGEAFQNFHCRLRLSIPWENVEDFFFRVAALAFEKSVLMEMERSNLHTAQIRAGNLIKMERNSSEASHCQAGRSCC